MSPSFALRNHAAIFALVFIIQVVSSVEGQAGDYLPWEAYVIKCVDTLIEHGRDRYGPIHADILISIVDVDALRSPAKPLWLDSEAYYEPGRAHRRSMRGSNFWYDQATIRVMYALTELANDRKFADAADSYIRAVYQHAVKDNELIVGGTHIYHDAYADKPAGDGDGRGPHETLVYHAQWPQLYRVEPEATRRAVDAFYSLLELALLQSDGSMRCSHGNRLAAVP